MCFSKKKTKEEKEAQEREKERVKQANQQPRASNVTGSNIGRSIIRSVDNRQMLKSKVTVREIADSDVVNMFENCTTQRIEVSSVTNEHNTYVRRNDYFDLSNEIHAKPNNAADVDYANYATPDEFDMRTPPVYRYYYDQSAQNITRNNIIRDAYY